MSIFWSLNFELKKKKKHNNKQINKYFKVVWLYSSSLVIKKKKIKILNKTKIIAMDKIDMSKCIYLYIYLQYWTWKKECE